jgi:polyferredoxin
VCPQGALEGGIPQVLLHYADLSPLLGTLFTSKMIILAFFLAIFLITMRPFCRAFCPVGAFLGLFNYVSILQFKVDEGVCKSCNLCVKSCPVEHDIYKSPNHPDCIRCGECITSCPSGSVKVSTIFSNKPVEKKAVL